MSLTQFKLSAPAVYRFVFSAAKQEEMSALITRYGATPTGIGRIIIQMGRNRIWREDEVSAALNVAGDIEGTGMESERRPTAQS
jgi:hypothetical protein